MIGMRAELLVQIAPCIVLTLVDVVAAPARTYLCHRVYVGGGVWCVSVVICEVLQFFWALQVTQLWAVWGLCGY